MNTPSHNDIVIEKFLTKLPKYLRKYVNDKIGVCPGYTELDADPGLGGATFMTDQRSVDYTDKLKRIIYSIPESTKEKRDKIRLKLYNEKRELEDVQKDLKKHIEKITAVIAKINDFEESDIC